MSYSGRPFGRRRRVGAAASRNEVSAAVGADGAAAIVWVSQPYESGDGGGPLGPAQLRVAYARPRSHFESAARPAKDLSIRSPHVAFDSNRNAVFVWRGANAIRAGEIRAGSVGLLPDIVPAGSEPVEIEALAAGPRRGRALVLWTAGDTSFTADPTYLRAAYRPDIASPFGPQEAVAPTAEDPYDAFAALDPVTGEATAVWARERGGTSGRLVEASVRR